MELEKRRVRSGVLLTARFSTIARLMVASLGSADHPRVELAADTDQPSRDELWREVPQIVDGVLGAGSRP